MADKPLAAFKDHIRTLTRRAGGRSMVNVAGRMRLYMLGWKAYFRLAQKPTVWQGLDKWIRRRMRALSIKQWGNSRTIRREILALSAEPNLALRIATSNKGYWRVSKAANAVLSIRWADQLGVPGLA